MIDYLQLIDAQQSAREGEWQALGRMSRYLKLLAREAALPIVCAVQLNRESEKRLNRKPRLADLRGSGNLEQDADTVILLHKPEAPDANRPEDNLEVEVAKNRDGPTGEITLTHRKARFELLEYSAP
jgi:replicative DNA helicase